MWRGNRSQGASAEAEGPLGGSEVRPGPKAFSGSSPTAVHLRWWRSRTHVL